MTRKLAQLYGMIVFQGLFFATRPIDDDRRKVRFHRTMTITLAYELLAIEANYGLL